MTNLCRVMSCEEQRAHVRLHRVYMPIAHAKLKQTRLFEHDGTYRIYDALQNRSCPMNWNAGAFIYRMTYDTYIQR